MNQHRRFEVQDGGEAKGLRALTDFDAAGGATCGMGMGHGWGKIERSPWEFHGILDVYNMCICL